MLTAEEVNGMLVSQLKEELKARGASVVGKKAELASRLLDIVQGAAAGSESSDIVHIEKGDITAQCNTLPASAEASLPAEELHPNCNSSAEVDTKDSEASAAVDNMDSEEVKPSNNEDYTHVRIDNFQRPLNQKALVEWIEKTCQCTLAPDSLWINSIKTHCYVDFNNYEEALRCISKVKGQRYPATSAYTLEADFTSIGAKEAPNSVEGATKPGEWKVAPKGTTSSNASELHSQKTKSNSGAQRDVVSPNRSTEPGEEMDIAAEVTAAHTPHPVPVGSKRRIDAVESTSSAGAENAGGTPGDAPEGKARRVAGLDIFRRATAGILFGNNVPATSAVNTTSPRHGSAAAPEAPAETPTVTGFVTRKVRTLGGTEAAGSSGSAGDATAASAAPEGLVLEDLFRKTVRTTPAVYWMPAPDDVVQQRLKSKLLLKSRK